MRGRQCSVSIHFLCISGSSDLDFQTYASGSGYYFQNFMNVNGCTVFLYTVQNETSILPIDFEVFECFKHNKVRSGFMTKKLTNSGQ
jgi:hypothetical protein